jgi:hypothetical protein
MRVFSAGPALSLVALRVLAADLSPGEPGLDYHSYANVDQFLVTHIELDLRFDLKDKEISGVAALEFKRLDPRATELVLDTKDLMINDEGDRCSGRHGQKSEHLGQPAVSSGKARPRARQRAGHRAAAEPQGRRVDPHRLRNDP